MLLYTLLIFMFQKKNQFNFLIMVKCIQTTDCLAKRGGGSCTCPSQRGCTLVQGIIRPLLVPHPFNYLYQLSTVPLLCAAPTRSFMLDGAAYFMFTSAPCRFCCRDLEPRWKQARNTREKKCP